LSVAEPAGAPSRRDAWGVAAIALAARLAVGEAVVLPPGDDVVELTDLGREVAEELAEMLLLDREPMRAVGLDEGPELAVTYAVVPLLDDHDGSLSLGS